jgi:hypothetical protein
MLLGFLVVRGVCVLLMAMNRGRRCMKGTKKKKKTRRRRE